RALLARVVEDRDEEVRLAKASLLRRPHGGERPEDVRTERVLFLRPLEQRPGVDAAADLPGLGVRSLLPAGGTAGGNDREERERSAAERGNPWGPPEPRRRNGNHARPPRLFYRPGRTGATRGSRHSPWTAGRRSVRDRAGARPSRTLVRAAGASAP